MNWGNPETIAERFASKVQIDKETGCHLWTGALTGPGYGKIWYDWKCVDAHRMIWFLTYGVFPKNDLHHICECKHCVNPDHLQEKTRKEHSHLSRMIKEQIGRTHCPKGHEYTEENTYRYKGHRSCKICNGNRSFQQNKQRRNQYALD